MFVVKFHCCRGLSSAVEEILYVHTSAVHPWLGLIDLEPGLRDLKHRPLTSSQVSSQASEVSSQVSEVSSQASEVSSQASEASNQASEASNHGSKPLN